MTSSLVLLVIVALVLLALAALKKKSGQGPAETPRRRGPVTKNEQPMYFRLRDAFPEHVVLAQVAFSALLTARHRRTRNTFDRKVADFVLCTKAFEVLAVIELDDSSHAGRDRQDAARDVLLTGAGYKVLRFKTVPDVDRLRATLQTLSAPTPT
jgi:very-short-patch-repair endonuclease